MTQQAVSTSPQPGAETLKALLTEHERDFSWLASKTGYSQSHLWRVVNEGRRISEDLALKLADVFGESPEAFLGDRNVAG